MQLTYRGIAHPFVPSVSATCQRQEVPAQYRGLAWSWPAQLAAVALPQSFVLTYRGLVLNPEVKAASEVISLRKDFMTLVKETHRQHLLSRLQERIRSAQARGDEHLLQQLEQERQLLA
ncbi:DUF4278 domain-containing protein [Synechococcus sp. H60.2]|uniref:DUF4278 domain-containing protein n=1 Tax=unclassified Synechococcus TaxID=2626047 RepID=UPI0039C3C7B4